MKRSMGFVFALICGATCAFAQTDVTAAAKPDPIKISDTEAVDISQAINGYMQGPTRLGRLDLFDRKKGKIVTLRLDRIVADDPARVVFPQPDQVAICGECTEVGSVKTEKAENKAQETGDRYEVWFLLQRGETVRPRVLDVIMKSVNGKPMYNWTKDESGKWSATLVPDKE